MGNYGERIAELRRQNNLTQGQLGEELCVTAQAVSKWERNLSEPDIGSIRKMSEYFGVSTDYLLGGDEPIEDESAEEAAAEAQPVRQVVAMCTKCGKALYEGDVTMAEGKALCATCNRNRLADIEYRKQKEEEERQNRFMQARADARARFVRPLRLASIVGGIALVFFIIIGVTGGQGATAEDIGYYWGGAAFLTLLAFAFTYEMKVEDSVGQRVFMAIAGFVVRMPGVIFTLDIDGLIFLIVAKLFLGLLGILISILLIPVAFLISSFISLFTCPYDLIVSIRDFRRF